ncbi:MAG: O-antigen ligase domain-containing protein [Chitinophagaceae bacterium]|nr:MAG: O-antigen ligase domain-containing protein [Chitinophagaceae bacterium]
MKAWHHDTTANKVSVLLLGLFAASLPFDRFYSQLLLIAVVAHTAIQLRAQCLRKLPIPWLLAISVPWLLTVLFTAGSRYTTEAFPFWERQLALFLFPLCVLLTGVDLHRYRRFLLHLFLLVNTGVALYLYSDALRTMLYHRQPLAALWSAAYLSHNFSAPLDIHATYLSLFFALSITAALYELLTGLRSTGRTLLLVLATLLLGAALLQLASRAVLISLLLIGISLLPLAIDDRRTRTAWWLFTGMVAAACFALLYFRAHDLYERLVTDLGTDLGTERGAGLVADPRGSRWKLAWALWREAPILGHGSGSEVQLLRDAYFRNGLYDSYLHALNAHNQYLSLLIRHGCAGLLCWMLALGYFARMAARRQDVLLGAFLLLIAGTSLSENILDVNKGIFFYACFLTLLGARDKNAGSSGPRSNPGSTLFVRIGKDRKPARP